MAISNVLQCDPFGTDPAVTMDGIFETHHQGQMFGKERFKEVVRRHHDRDAAGIRKAIIEAVDDFRGRERQEDDVTLVVMKKKKDLNQECDYFSASSIDDIACIELKGNIK